MIDIGPFQLGQMDIGSFQSEVSGSGITASGNLFIEGFLPTVSGEMPLFIAGPIQLTESIHLFLRGNVSGLTPSVDPDDDFGMSLDVLFTRGDHNPQIIGRFITDPNSVTIQIYNVISGVNTLVTLDDNQCYQIGDTGRWAWSTVNLPELQNIVNQYVYVMTGDNAEIFKGKFILKNTVKINNKIPRNNSHIRRI
jgi:hypothetical protein